MFSIFLAVDVHFQDKLEKLKLSDQGIYKRDEMVIENFIIPKNTIMRSFRWRI